MIRLPSLLIAGAFAGAAILAPVHGARAADEAALTSEFSAQQNRQKTTVKRTTTPRRTTTTRTTTRPSGATRTKSVTTTRSGAVKRTTTVRTPAGATRSTTVVRRAPLPPRTVTFTGPRRTYTGLTARRWAVGGGTWVYAGRPYRYWRGGPWRVRYGTGWRTFVAVGLIAPIAVGAATYYPYAYVDAPADVCEGVTEDGCQLTWTEVELEGGGTAPQCVTYCPWQQ